MAPINLNASRLALPDAGLRALQIITVAMITAVAAFAAVVLVVAGAAVSPPAGHQTATLLGFLSLLHVVLAGTCYAAAGMLFSRMTRRVPDMQEEGEAPEPFPRLRGALIVRLALMETPAWVGLMLCLLGVLWGAMQEEPAYWLNLFSTAVFLLFAVRTFPTRAGVEYLLSRMGTIDAG